MKKVGKYLVISLLLLLGLCCVGVLYLFFIPDSSLFNITYINHNKKIKSPIYKAEDVSHVIVNSRAYDVEIVSTSKNEVTLELFTNSFGFVLTKNENATLSSSIKNNILTFNIEEPYGGAVKNNSYIRLHVSSEYEVDVTLNNKSAITIIDSSNVKINNLTYSTNSGNFYFNRGTIKGSMNLNLNKSDFKIAEAVETNSNDVQLKLTSGKFYATKEVLGDVKILKNTRGVIKISECNRFSENIYSAGGRINLDKASYVNILTSDSNISIKEVADGANIELTGSGNVDIESLKAISTIKTKSGNINVKNAESNVILHSDTGNIKVSSAKTVVSTKTNNGEIEIHFAEEAESYKNSANGLQYRVLNARLYNGKLTATGVEHLGLVGENEGVQVTGNGRINIKMNDVIGSNEISGKNGNLSLVVNKDSVYSLLTKSTSGNVRVNLTQTIQYGGYTDKEHPQTNVNCSSTSSNLLIATTTSGNLSILDTNFAN